MTPDRWEQLKRVFQGALQPSIDIQAYLDRECAGDPELRREVEALLESNSEAGDFLETPVGPARLTEAIEDQPRAGEKTIGPYRVIREIGRGGMGTVYLAERCDGHYEKKVAIKLVSAGMDTGAVLSRFRTERQILANLDHPNIARLLDGGVTPEGRPYIVMEFIDGLPIDEYCDRRGLSLEERLNLFRVVCAAVHHAHENHVVHRDIKPGNILVTEAGVPKLLDFGIGKMHGPNPAAATKITTQFRPMTPDFASPEQLRGEEVTAASDIYSLGIVLYILLTGAHPCQSTVSRHGSFTGPALNTAIETPSRAAARKSERDRTLTRRLSGDLDNIAMMALRAEAHRRYGTAEEFAEDIRRHLESHPIKARPETLSYRAAKYVQRNKSHLKIASYSVAACLLVAAGLLGAFRATLFSNAIPFEARDWVILADFDNRTGEEIFDRSLNTALSVSLGQSAHLNVFPRRSIEGSLRRMKADPGAPLDAPAAVKVAAREGLKLVVAPSIERDGASYIVKAGILDPQSGRVLRSEDVPAAGRDRVLRALDEVARRVRIDLGEAATELAKQDRPIGDAVTSSLEALKLFSRGTESLRGSRFDEGRDLYRQALAIDPSFTAATGALGMLEFEIFDRNSGRQLLSQALQGMSQLTTYERYSLRAFYDTAVENDLAKAENDWKELIAIYPDASHAHNNLGRVYRFMGRWEEAAASFRRAIEIDPYLGLSYENLAWIYENRLGDLDSAIALCKQQISYDEQNANGYNYLGWAYLGKGDLEQARAAFEKALQRSPNDSLVKYFLAHTYRLQRHYPDAIRTYLDIIATDKREAIAHYLAGIVYEASGDRTQARRHFEEFRADAASRVSTQPANVEAHFELAKTLARLGSGAEAKRAIDAGLTARGERELSPDLQFAAATAFSVIGNTRAAVDRLTAAVRGGFRDYTSLKIDPDLASVQDDPAFKQLLETVPAKPQSAPIRTSQR